jgi:predicted ATP-dependent endonuclease of OLD family
MEEKQSESSYTFSSAKTLSGYNKINVILGRNGSGKSILLRDLQKNPKSSKKIEFTYISPERGGSLSEDLRSTKKIDDPKHLQKARDMNIVDNFKQQSYTRLIELCTKENNKICDDVVGNEKNEYYKCKRVLDKINELLDNITLKLDTKLTALNKLSNKTIPIDEISSGEGQLICLATEFLCFLDGIKILHNTEYWLLLDEPDAHLHPDLQDRFIKFIAESIKDSKKIKIFIATHSTVILSSLSHNKNATVAFVKTNPKQVAFYEINKYLKEILPVFGAHPLTRVFYEAAILFVEGDDEVRVFQKIIRSSQGKVKLYPIPCGGKENINKYIKETNNIVASIYDNAKIYALFDGDKKGKVLSRKKEIDGNVKKIYLQCYGAENLLLTDEFLKDQKTNWTDIQKKIKNKLDSLNTSNPKELNKAMELKKVYESRKEKLKDSIHIICDILNIEGSWQIEVGKCIWKYIKENKDKTDILIKESGSMASFLGVDLMTLLKEDIK